ncbi:TPA: helix-turn-helix transcriptional regulator [Yersinia enterocolitica]|uniref:helix-turn-helix domain-containing protein n=1 Tax=Yersinia enterocolitica TaxID=630 RepID=UPI0005DD6AA6|nr:AraC family transcriptional regulator [Yersinia enterocolitica]EKN3778196.1 helix-turn-helix transcriptional regulator [Yersinia enterocolitica]EKN3871440.1 helix-turn-helix transcriptional regulator [Yersinia enterocolitica]EKN4008756.1 helix-turn-helix transcriptional regulator [Yersinia enterocolitica]EKN4746175.1 helix-turn-helix transcriptional regulator [Yersinia enterocolitica]EKN4762252.1 helix-turn-helix transcriptional regulator [Yersinia enterocolitica]
MLERYQAFETLREHKARLHDCVQLGSGIQLAAWSNRDDCVTQENPDHHTLSLYVADGYECYHKTRAGWKNGGGPDRFCIMPKGSLSSWDVRDDLSFVHLYCTDNHLRQLAEQIWERSPQSIQVDERIFAEDPQITLLYRQFLLNYDWQEQANHLALSSAATLLMTHLLKTYTQLQWAIPAIRGGLAPVVLKRVKEYIDSHLAQPLLLSDLAEQAGLSEFHFARMFKQSTGLAPHQFVLKARLCRADQLIRYSLMPIIHIALECGFSSASHFSNCFKVAYGVTPSLMRQRKS